MQVTCTDYYDKAHLVDSKDIIDTTRAYGVCIIDQKVLLIQDTYSRRWELPGGGVEKNETAHQGLIREFIEETGAVPKGDLIFLAEWVELFFDTVSDEAWRAKRKFYLVESIQGKLLEHGNNNDSAAARFVHLDELLGLPMTDRIRQVIHLASVTPLKN